MPYWLLLTMNPSPQSHDVFEGMIVHPYAMAGGDRFDRLRQKGCGRYPATRRLAASDRIALSPASVPRPFPPGLQTAAISGVSPRVGRFKCRVGVLHDADAIAILGIAIDRHPHPAVEYSQRQKDFLTDVLLERPTIDSAKPVRPAQTKWTRRDIPPSDPESTRVRPWPDRFCRAWFPTDRA